MEKDKTIVRRWIIFFMVSLFLSGLTAIPLQQELLFLLKWIPRDNSFAEWLDRVYTALAITDRSYPFLSYGYDWLAFAHFVLAILFFGPLRDPVRNKWIIEFAMIACILVIPYAMIAGHFRGIPMGWRLIDCAFGVFGLIPLWVCLKKIRRMEAENPKTVIQDDATI